MSTFHLASAIAVCQKTFVMTKTSSVSKLEKIGVGYMFLILLFLNLLIFFMPGKEKVEKVEVSKQKAIPEVKEPIQKAPELPSLGSIEISQVIWANPDEIEMMKVKFKLTNNNLYPVSEIEVEFKYYDVLGVLLEGGKIKTVSDIIAAGEEKEYDAFELGSYPKDTVKVTGEVVSVSRAPEDLQ